MSAYRERAAREIREEQPAATVGPIMAKLVLDSAAMLARGPADARAAAAAARAHAVENLDALHDQLRAAFARQGVGYHRAGDAAEAVAIVHRLLGDAKRVAKSKSMVAEEIGLTHNLRAAGIDVLETDIGEYIVDIEGRGPSHITAPALHLDRVRIRALLERAGATLPDDDPVRLSRFVRDVVGAYVAECDAGITGANALIASSGRLLIVENEGNVALGASHPRLHISVTGIEKVVADEAAALAVLQVLAPSATAQPLTSFTHFLGAPDPGQERHVVLVDNGRSAMHADERYRDVLRCIRCGACMNGCPVYRAAGGLSYGSPYMGPIGAVVSPLIWRDGRYADLPLASSLCGRCTEVCPVGISLHRMLLDLRADAVEAGEMGGAVERAAWKAWAFAFAGVTRARVASAAGRLGLRGLGRVAGDRGAWGGVRALPRIDPERDPAALAGDPAVPAPDLPVPGAPDPEPTTLPARFRVRAAALGVEVVPVPPPPRTGDRHLRATAAVASTGSVLLTGEAAARRPLLAAGRVIVEVPPEAIVPYPRDLAPFLGAGDALLLTGASRTADIEKQIVRGIHGSEELVVVLPASVA